MLEATMYLMGAILIGAIPALTLVGMLGLTLYYFLTEKMRQQTLGKHHNHPDKDMPLYNVGHCDGYSAGTFSW